MSLENHGNPWSDAEEKKLRELYPDRDTAELVEEFGRTHEAIRARANSIGLQKSEDWDGSGTAVSEAALKRGVEAELQFEEFAEENGWEWYKNNIFRQFAAIDYKIKSEEYFKGLENYYQRKKRDNEKSISDPDKDWVNEERLRRELRKIRELIEERPDWFFNLREEVDEALEEYNGNSRMYPDYVVRDPSDGPFFVEVKYGTSTLMKKQKRMFGFLQDRGFDVYIFRKKPTGEVDFSEWDGGWK